MGDLLSRDIDKFAAFKKSLKLWENATEVLLNNTNYEVPH